MRVLTANSASTGAIRSPEPQNTVNTGSAVCEYRQYPQYRTPGYLDYVQPKSAEHNPEILQVLARSVSFIEP